MHIFLVNPRASMGDTFYPHLGLSYLKSYLEDKNPSIQVCIIDLSLVSEKMLLQQVAEKQPRLVGFSTFSTSRFVSLDLARAVKEISSEAMIVLGGFHASYLYEQIMENFSWIDFIIRGEGEKTLSELIDCLLSGRSFEGIRGLVFRKEGTLGINEKRPYIENLDILPFPYYIPHEVDLLGKRRKAATVITSRGCSGACKFCAAPSFWGKPRFRSTRNIMEELTGLVEKHGVEFIYFMDDTFTESPPRVYEICQAIEKKKWNLLWRATARINTLNESILKAMKSAGCVEIAVGIESGSQDILGHLGKRVSLEKIEEVAKSMKDLNIQLHACFIVGSPGESRQTIQETQQLIRKIRADSFSVSRSLYLFPGTVFNREFLKKRFCSEAEWLDRDVDNIRYLNEHDEHQLARWQLALLITCWWAMPFKGKIRYLRNVLTWLKPAQILKGWGCPRKPRYSEHG
ncbi:MAG: radical SAM protein [Candidatus Omnitrophica bacterium]|nr:radical SAM protein [Candidatus Omnitrophota bacterium]